VSDFRGLNVSEVTELRRTLKATRAEMQREFALVGRALDQRLDRMERQLDEIGRWMRRNHGP